MAVNKPNVTTYQEFRGVDYSASPAVISDNHAQDMLNMYIGEDGVMQKRPGWHILKTFLEYDDFNIYKTYAVGRYVKYQSKYYKCTTEHTGEWNADHFEESVPPRLPINGIHVASIGADINHLYIHAGTRLYRVMFAPNLRHIQNRVNDPGDVPYFKTENDYPTQAEAAYMNSAINNGLIGLEDWQIRNMDINKDGNVTEKDYDEFNKLINEAATGSNGVLDSSYLLVRGSDGNHLEMANAHSVSFAHDGRLYILDGTHYYEIMTAFIGQTVTAIGGDVNGYIPTTGVNGHYEYAEPQVETTEGATIVERTTVTVASGSTSATFTAAEEIKDKHILVTLVINSHMIANALYLEPSSNTVNVGYAQLAYSGGSITVTSNAAPFDAGDKITLFIKEEDTEVVISGEPGSETNPGVWKRPEHDEDRNLLTAKQINTFAADGIHKAYYLTENGCTVHKVELYLWTRCKSVNGVDVPTQENIDHVDAGTYNGIYYYYKYIWTDIASNDATYGWTARDASSQTKLQNEISYTTRIRFNAAPDAAKDGSPNIRVTFSPNKHSSTWAVAKDRGYIEKCSICTKFGYFNDNRYWFAGNPEHRNMDFMSAVDDPTYFPNTGWTKVGSSHTAIQGYLKYGSELAIIKEDNQQDATVYMRSANITEDGVIYFPVQQGAQGVGAISKYCLKTLKDEPLFLAKEGVFAIQGTNASQERTIPNRSFFVDKRLRQDATPDSVAEIYKDYYIICNPSTGRCYVADSRYQGLPPGTNDRNRVYEWYVWDNIPARSISATDEYLFFGTVDGRLCLFNTDWNHPKRWTDGAEFVSGSTVWHKWHPYDGGYPIHAYYVTKRDHLETLDFKKTMLNDGGVIALRPHEQSSASITVKTDKGEWFVDHIQTDSDEPSVVVPIRRRFKNFDSIETRIENKELREGLSILGIQYRYYLGTNRR